MLVDMPVAARIALCTAVATVLWIIANWVSRTSEPWDSQNFGIFYLLALGIAAGFGYVFPSRAWLWGVIIIFAQLPVMLVQSGVGPLTPLGIIILAGLSLPAALVASACARVARWWQRHRNTR